MIDLFCIFTTTGLVLWSKSFCELKGTPINKLIKDVILVERTNEKVFYDDQYALKWSFNNDLGLVFVVVFDLEFLRVLDQVFDLEFLRVLDQAFDLEFLRVLDQVFLLEFDLVFWQESLDMFFQQI